jgi:hypothetical protein
VKRAGSFVVRGNLITHRPRQHRSKRFVLLKEGNSNFECIALRKQKSNSSDRIGIDSWLRRDSVGALPTGVVCTQDTIQREV